MVFYQNSFVISPGLLYHLIRRDSGRLANEAFTSNPTVCSKEWFNGLKITNWKDRRAHWVKTNSNVWYEWQRVTTSSSANDEWQWVTTSDTVEQVTPYENEWRQENMGWMPTTLLKSDSNTSVFPWILQKF